LRHPAQCEAGQRPALPQQRMAEHLRLQQLAHRRRAVRDDRRLGAVHPRLHRPAAVPGVGDARHRRDECHPSLIATEAVLMRTCLSALAVALLFASSALAADATKPRALRIGAVAYSPESVKAWKNMQIYFAKKGFPIDYVLYSNYDALVDSLKSGHVDVAWNTPLAHARYHVLCGGESQTLVMRDVDRGFRAVVIAKKGEATKPEALAGKTLVLGSKDAAEATVLPLYYLKKQGVKLDKVKLLSLHDECDDKGCPCRSERDVLKALEKGRGQAGVI